MGRAGRACIAMVCPRALTALAAWSALAVAAAVPPEGVPPLVSLSSAVQTVRVCNAAALPRAPCHGRPVGTWATKAACLDAGCCWFTTAGHGAEDRAGAGAADGGGCFAPSDQCNDGTDTVARYAANQQPPSLSNAAGMLRAPPTGDPLAVTCVTLPPYAGECSEADSPLTLAGGMTLSAAAAGAPSHGGGATTMSAARVSVAAAGRSMWFQWRPFEISRGATAPVPGAAAGSAPARVNTTVRMRFQRRHVLLVADVALPAGAGDVDLTVNVPGVVALSGPSGPAWGWPVPRPTSSSGFAVAEAPCGDSAAASKCLVSRDGRSGAVTAVGVVVPASNGAEVVAFNASAQPPTVTWRLAAGATVRVQLSVAVGNSTAAVLSEAAMQGGGGSAAAFDDAWADAQARWEQWWEEAFTPPGARRAAAPGDPVSFGGNLPALETNDTALSRVYYSAAVSLLANAVVDPDVGAGPFEFGSAGPVSAVTAEYIWDTTLNAVLFSMLEPTFLRRFALSWVGPQLHSNYAIDFVTRRFVGPWYSFNDWQMSRAIHTLARFAEGESFYAEPTPGPVPGASGPSTVADFVVWMATFWRSLSAPAPELVTVSGNSAPAAQAPAAAAAAAARPTEAAVTAAARPAKAGVDRHGARDGAAGCDCAAAVSGHWFGFWARAGKPSVPDTKHVVTLATTPAGTVTASQSPADGWDSGNGTVASAPGGGCAIALSLFLGGQLHASLRGTVQASNCTLVEWDNDSDWCRNGSTPACTAVPPPPPDGLADYGGASNLLECVPTYTHKVAALNAANAWLMREAADVLDRARRRKGQHTGKQPQEGQQHVPQQHHHRQQQRHQPLQQEIRHPRQQHLQQPQQQQQQQQQQRLSTGAGPAPAWLRGAAANLSAAVQRRLYVQGKGWWACEQPDGSLVEVRHVIDFATVGHALAGDLPASTASEMAAFFSAELRTPHWLRALSLGDAAAPRSDRKDHGPFGAYDGWLGESVVALSRLGRRADALNLTRSMAPVYARGPGGQSHQVFTLPGAPGVALDLPAKAAADQQYFALSGGVVAGAIVTELFGVRPARGDGPPAAADVLGNASAPRGFEGRLVHVPVRGGLYTVASGAGGLTAVRER